MSDMHLGDVLFNHVEFRKFCEFIMEEPYRFLVINGDIINNNLKSSVGSPYDDIISPNDQKKEAIRMLLMIRDRIICMNGGNHEARSKKEAGLDVTEEIADGLGVPYNENENFIKLSFGKTKNTKRQVYGIYLTHGSGGGKKPGGLLNNLEDLSKNILADVYILGHGHKRLGHKAVLRVPDMRNNKITETVQLYVAAAAWLNYGGYAAQKMYRPQVRGAHPVVFNGNIKEATTII